jgi:hypothetical protein
MVRGADREKKPAQNPYRESKQQQNGQNDSRKDRESGKASTLWQNR